MDVDPSRHLYQTGRLVNDDTERDHQSVLFDPNREREEDQLRPYQSS